MSQTWECAFKAVIFISFLDILHEIGLLQFNEIIEVHRSDLVSKFLGDMAKKNEKKIKQAFGKELFVDEAYTLISKSAKDFGKEATESIMRYMLPSTGSVKHPVFIFASYSANMEEFLDTNIGLRGRIKLKLMVQDNSPVDLSGITLRKLLKCKIRLPLAVENLLTQCFDSIPKNVRSVLNASLCSDLMNIVRTKQESRLSFDVSNSDAIKYTKEDFQLGNKSLIDNIGMKTKYVEKSYIYQELVLYLAHPYSEKRKCIHI